MSNNILEISKAIYDRIKSIENPVSINSIRRLIRELFQKISEIPGVQGAVLDDIVKIERFTNGAWAPCIAIKSFNADGEMRVIKQLFAGIQSSDIEQGQVNSWNVYNCGNNVLELFRGLSELDVTAVNFHEKRPDLIVVEDGLLDEMQFLEYAGKVGETVGDDCIIAYASQIDEFVNKMPVETRLFLARSSAKATQKAVATDLVESFVRIAVGLSNIPVAQISQPLKISLFFTMITIIASISGDVSKKKFGNFFAKNIVTIAKEVLKDLSPLVEGNYIASLGELAIQYFIVTDDKLTIEDSEGDNTEMDIEKQVIIDFASKTLKGQTQDNLRQGMFIVPANDAMALAKPHIPENFKINVLDGDIVEASMVLPIIDVSGKISDVRLVIEGLNVTAYFKVLGNFISKPATELALRAALNHKNIPFTKTEDAWCVDISGLCNDKLINLPGKYPDFTEEIDSIMKKTKIEILLQEGNFVIKPSFVIEVEQRAAIREGLTVLGLI